MMSTLPGVTDDASRKQPKNPLGPTGNRVMANIKRLRQSQGLTYKELSDRLDLLGRPIPVLGLSRLEKGERRVDADDLVVLALALGVTPNRLLLPDVDPLAEGESRLTPSVAGDPVSLWEWAQGEQHPALPFEGSHSWLGGGKPVDAAFALANRPYLTRLASTEDVLAPAGDTTAADARSVLRAVLNFLADGLGQGRRPGPLASQVRRIVELAIVAPSVLSAEERSDLARPLPLDGKESD
jgi:transcriptional regulator with XRE-family HTH domain